MRAMALLALLLAAPALLAADDPRTEPLSTMDERFMATQRNKLDEIARRELGRQFSGEPAQDLGILQELLDRQLVRRDETALLQGMGIVLGDLLAKQEGLKWVVYIDEVGRSRALTEPGTGEFLFPVTMISRRVEAGIDVNVREIYERAVGMARDLKGRTGWGTSR